MYKSIIELSASEYEAVCERAKETARGYDYPYLAKQIVEVIKSIEEQN